MAGLKYSNTKVIVARILEYFFLPALIFTRKSKRTSEAKILIVEPFHIGDAVSLSVMLDPLRERFPNHEIHLLLQNTPAKLYENDKRVSYIHRHVLPWAKRANKYNVADFLETAKTILFLRRERFLVGIDVRGDVRSQIFLTLVGCSIRAGYTNYLCSNIIIKGHHLTHNAGNLVPQQRAMLNLEVLKVLGCSIKDARSGLIAANAQRRETTKRRKTFEVICHMGSGWKYRLWKESNWLNLWEKISQEFQVGITLVGEKDKIKHIKSSYATELEMYRVNVLSTSFEGMIDAISRCNLFIGLDSGPMHIAAAFDKIVIALFGPGNIEIWQPHCKEAILISRQDKFPCAPCLQSKCIHPMANCMDAISPDEVMKQVYKCIPASSRKEQAIT